MVNEGVDSAIGLAEKMDKSFPYLEETIGSIPYHASQIGVVGAGVVGALALAYMTTKGAGMWFDKHWYKTES